LIAAAARTRRIRVLVAPDFQAADLVAMHFVGPVR
jgi:hypothetical protein